MQEDKNLEILCEKIEYEFKDKELLINALSHPSLCYARKKKRIDCPNYERLELIGDSVLSLNVLDLLMDYFKYLNEGEISRRKSYLVCTETLSNIAKIIGVGEHIYMTKGEENQEGRNNNHILENVMEAIIGAIYFDGGIEASRSFVKKYWFELIKNQVKVDKDPKSRLQEWTQKKKYGIPTYTVVAESGDDGNPMFSMEVSVNDDLPKIAREARNKKEAEIASASALIEYIKENVDKKI